MLIKKGEQTILTAMDLHTNKFYLVVHIFFALLILSLSFTGRSSYAAVFINHKDYSADKVSQKGVIDRDLKKTEKIETIIKRGETISSLLSPYLDKKEIDLISSQCVNIFPLTKIRAGRECIIFVCEDDFKKFKYDIDKEEYLLVERSKDGFTAKRVPFEYEIQKDRIKGTIKTSLYNSLIEIGEKPELAMRLEDIYGWEIDFFRDIKENDSFRLLVEKKFIGGNFAGYGNVLAVEFVNNGKNLEAFLMKNADGRVGYYDGKGRNMKKAFLKAPLSFTRISSNFSASRFHPVHKRYMPHPAIDYAAPTGTPVMAIGDGVVIKAARRGGNGRYVKLRHANGYESAYLHLSRFAKSAKVGSRVAQGEVIGYVGATGVATGPHLDFRMRKNGSYINPRKIDNTRAKPLSADLMAAFGRLVEQRTAALRDDSPVLVEHDPEASRGGRPSPVIE